MENRHIDVSAAPINQWWLVGVFVAVGAVVGVVYSLLTGGTFKIGVAVGASIAGGIALFEVGYVHHARGRWLRRAPLALFLVISMAVWFTVMTFSLEVLPYWLGDVSDRVSDRPLPSTRRRTAHIPVSGSVRFDADRRIPRLDRLPRLPARLHRNPGKTDCAVRW